MNDTSEGAPVSAVASAAAEDAGSKHHDGYRPNVAIVLMNDEHQVLWARRIGGSGWQFPQGGVQSGETPEQAAFRELYEEVGLRPEHVRLLGRTRGWLPYRLPRRMTRPGFKGQKQIWFLFRFLAGDERVCLDHSDAPEFDRWCWVAYWQPLQEIIEFKRDVYQQALAELSQLPVLRGIVPAEDDT